jgi:hypothetical protein
MWFYGEGVYLPLFVEYAPAYRTGLSFAWRSVIDIELNLAIHLILRIGGLLDPSCWVCAGIHNSSCRRKMYRNLSIRSLFRADVASAASTVRGFALPYLFSMRLHTEHVFGKR